MTRMPIATRTRPDQRKARIGATTPNMDDPLRRHREGVVANGASGVPTPIPLKSTAIDVSVRSAFATVRTTRVFANAEADSIEATMTFPVPVDAVAHGLRVLVDGRDMVGVAKAKAQARATYEEAVDSGRTAVLHEEVLKGVHTLAVSHVPPGKEVSVEISWSKPLSFYGAAPSLRVPNTVAEVYGRSPLLPADDIVTHDEAVFEAQVTVAVDEGIAHVRGHAASGGTATVKLDRPLDLTFTGTGSAPLTGTSADGRVVTLSVVDDAAQDGPLALGVLFDRSGSTDDPIQGDAGRARSVWEASRAGLREALAKDLRPGDTVDLWSFHSRTEHLGRATGQAAVRLVDAIEGPTGGTETAVALGVATSAEGLTDVLVVTDGRGHIDVQGLASRGRRVSAVLCGENSLDVSVGHLVALTGGQVLVAAGDDVTDAIRKVVASTRRPSSASLGATLVDLPEDVTEYRAGAEVRITWSGARGVGGACDAVGAYAAGIALPMMTEAAATAVAVAHGLCTHLTSLVVVDESTQAQEGLPSQRKVPLSRPYETAAAAPFLPAGMGASLSARAAGSSASLSASRRSFASIGSDASASWTSDVVPGRTTGTAPGNVSAHARTSVARGGAAKGPAPAPARPVRLAGGRVPGLSAAAIAVDWDGDANRLSRGDVDHLPEGLARALRSAAEAGEVKRVATASGTTPLLVVIGLLALSARDSRGAARIAKRLLADVAPADVEAVRKALGL